MIWDVKVYSLSGITYPLSIWKPWEVERDQDQYYLIRHCWNATSNSVLDPGHSRSRLLHKVQSVLNKIKMLNLSSRMGGVTYLMTQMREIYTVFFQSF